MNSSMYMKRSVLIQFNIMQHLIRTTITVDSSLEPIVHLATGYRPRLQCHI